jgi:hypothetical protein
VIINCGICGGKREKGVTKLKFLRRNKERRKTVFSLEKLEVSPLSYVFLKECIM